MVKQMLSSCCTAFMWANYLLGYFNISHCCSK